MGLDDAGVTMLRPLDSIVRGLVRRPWLFTAFTVAVCAALAARAATSVLAAEYLGEAAAPPAVQRPQPPPPPAAAHRPATGDQLVARNMFCSSCESVAIVGGDLALPPAVLIAITEGRSSSATLHVLTSEVQGSWDVGDTVPGLGRIDRITASAVELVDPAGRRGRLSLRSVSEPAAGSSGAATPADSPAAPPWSARIKRLDDQNYEVDRDLIRELVNGVARADGVRPVPILEDGQIKGLRLLGVRPTSIPGALGLRSGDVLSAIDGEPIRNAQQLLDLYAKLDQLSAVELAGTRAGKPLVRTLRLR